MQRLLMLIFLGAIAWAIGLTAFVARLPEASSGTPEIARIGDDDTARTGVVVFTGGGARLDSGMTLFAGGTGERLLISGVHDATTRERLSELWQGAPDQFDCCVDLGREATSTEGNAEEVSQWANEQQYKVLVLVTSDYHMPRAVTATRGRMPDTRIIPYVVASGYLDDQGRPVSVKAWRHLSGEYSKFLLVRIKAFFASLF